MRRLGVSLSLLALSTLAPLGAEENLVSQGFDHFYNLEYDQALALFHQADARNSNSADVHNHLAETILFREMLRDGALESELVSGDNSFLRRAKLNPSPETKRDFLNDVSAAISLASKRLESNPNDTGALYALGIAYGLRANYNWLVNKSWRESLRDATAELSQMYSMAGEGQKALAAVEGLIRAKAAHTPGLDRVAWEKIYFQEGTIQFWYRDLDHSLANLSKVAAAADNLDLNTGAFAYLRIGQIYDMTSRRGQAISAYKKCIAFAPEADAARESRKYLASPYHRL